MVDVLIIAFVVAGVCLAVRSIARNFSKGSCASCGNGKHCAAAHMDADELSCRVAEALHKGN